MRTLYLSTDQLEAMRVVHGRVVPRIYQNKLKLNFYDIDEITGAGLVERVGFNPMSAIEFPDNIQARYIEDRIKLFAKEGFYATLLNSEGKFIQNKLGIVDRVRQDSIAERMVRPNSRPKQI